MDLLRAVLDSPASDDARLVYADYLLERGDPRGELIAVQIAAARNETDPTLRLREVLLLRENRLRWVAAFAGLRIARRLDVRFDRGFISAVEGDGADLAEASAALFAHEPVTSVTIRDGDVEALLRTGPVLERIRSLTVRALRARNAKALFASRELSSLRTLTLDPSRGVIETSTRNGKPFASPVDVDLSKTSVEDGDVVALTESSWFTCVRTLDLRNTRIRDAGAKAIAWSPNAAGLTSLQIGENAIGSVGMGAIADSNCLPALRHLDIRRTWAVPRVFASPDALPNLVTLAIDGSVEESVCEALRARFGNGLRIG